AEDLQSAAGEAVAVVGVEGVGGQVQRATAGTLEKDTRRRALGDGAPADGGGDVVGGVDEDVGTAARVAGDGGRVNAAGTARRPGDQDARPSRRRVGDDGAVAIDDQRGGGALAGDAAAVRPGVVASDGDAGEGEDALVADAAAIGSSHVAARDNDVGR